MPEDMLYPMKIDCDVCNDQTNGPFYVVCKGCKKKAESFDEKLNQILQIVKDAKEEVVS